MAARRPSEQAGFAASTLITAGGLMAVLCGGCTLLFDVMALPGWLKVATMRGAPSAVDAYQAAWAGVVLVASLVVGWIPTLVGIAMVVIGLRLRRRDRRRLGD